MANDPTVIAAIIGGTVTVILAALSGLFAYIKSRKRSGVLAEDLLAKAGAEKFIAERTLYINGYPKFSTELVSINEKNPDDGTQAIQFAVDFFGRTSRNFYLSNRTFLRSKTLDLLLNKVESTVESGQLNDPDAHALKRRFGENIVSFCSELYKRALTTL
jgi:hypothetical protein